LLCGGVGKRMFPLREDKVLLKFLGKPLLWYQMERAREAGLRQFVIVANPDNAERIEHVAREVPNVDVRYAIQEQPLGIADAVLKAEPLLGKEVVIVNPNDVFDGSAYAKLIQERGNGAVSCVLGYRVAEHFPGGYLVVDPEGNLQQIVEKPPRGREPSDLVNILVHFHSDVGKLLAYAKATRSVDDDVYERALDSMVKDGNRITVVPYTDFWSAIKYPWHIFKIVRYFLDRAKPAISATARVSSKATIEGKVIIEDNVRVLENAVIRGPAYIGSNTIIGNNVLVREYSHIGADCVVGYSTEVKSSYVGDRCWFHSSYIGDSVVADGCSFGAGTVLANYRFDEKSILVRVGNEDVDTGLDKLGAMVGENSKTGVNTSVLPGIRIGSNSFVGPHVCLTKDLESNRMVLPEPQYRVLPKDIELDEKKKTELMRKLERM
ncbi:MAG: sugar phosphate nucleotidyltransferase, partial [Chloroflexi bacterium]|nr:sugar phosphate nucleotidyltransferase [Chloroflexota bacterium]